MHQQAYQWLVKTCTVKSSMIDTLLMMLPKAIPGHPAPLAKDQKYECLELRNTSVQQVSSSIKWQCTDSVRVLCIYIYVCMYGWMDGWMGGWMDNVCMYVCMDGWMDGWVDGWMDG